MIRQIIEMLEGMFDHGLSPEMVRKLSRLDFRDAFIVNPDPISNYSYFNKRSLYKRDSDIPPEEKKTLALLNLKPHTIFIPSEDQPRLGKYDGVALAHELGHFLNQDTYSSKVLDALKKERNAWATTFRGMRKAGVKPDKEVRKLGKLVLGQHGDRVGIEKKGKEYIDKGQNVKGMLAKEKQIDGLLRAERSRMSAKKKRKSK
jgi:hypothetical protein